ncbi:MAG: thioredoxin [Kiritimatiellales bacterium]
MSDKVKILTVDNFNTTVAAGNVLVDFFATWCGPCKMQEPILEKVADAVAGKAVVAKVNVDEAPALAAQFGVRSIPTILIFKGGEKVREFMGVQQEATLVEALS